MSTLQPEIRTSKRFERLTDAHVLTMISGGILIMMCLASVLFMGDSGFNKPQMFLDILNYYSYLIIISCALTIVMIGGGINISVGGVICLTCMACSIFLNDSGIENGVLLLIATFLLAIGIGAIFGAFQGALISYLGIQPFIITLAGMFLARGLTTMLSGGGNVNVPDSNPFTALEDAVIKIPFLGYMKQKRNVSLWIDGNLHLAAVIAIAVVILIYLVMRYTKFGRNTYAIGGNQQSAQMLGINVKRTRFNTYLLSGTLSGLAGFVFMMYNGAAGKTGIGLRSEMDAIAASIIGGTLLSGGVGNVIGSFFGAAILGTLQKIIWFSGLQESYWQDMASGVMLGLFIVLQSVVLSVRSKGTVSLTSWLKSAKSKPGNKTDTGENVKA